MSEQNCYTDYDFPNTSTKDQMLDLMCVVKLNFNALPSTYNLEDYLLLIDTVSSSLNTLYQNLLSTELSDPSVHFYGSANTLTNPDLDMIRNNWSFPPIYILSASGTYVKFNQGQLSVLPNELIDNIIFAIPLLTTQSPRSFIRYEKKVFNFKTSKSTITSDIEVVLSEGKTFGKYINGDTIPSAGKSFELVLNMIAQEPINPVVTTECLSGFSDLLKYNQESILVGFRFDYLIKNKNATYKSYKLFYSLGDGEYTQFSITPTESLFNETSGYAKLLYTYEFQQETDENKDYNVKVVVTDSDDCVLESIFTIHYLGYVQNECTLQTTCPSLLEKNKGGLYTWSGHITLNNEFEQLQSLLMHRKVGDSDWEVYYNIDNNAIDENMDFSFLYYANPDNLSTQYRIVVIADQNSYSNVISISRKQYTFIGCNGLIRLGQITNEFWGNMESLNKQLNDNINCLFNNITAGTFDYLYFAYPEEYGNISLCVLNESSDITGAWIKIGTSNYLTGGAVNVPYIIYRSTAPGAYNNDTLKFE